MIPDYNYIYIYIQKEREREREKKLCEEAKCHIKLCYFFCLKDKHMYMHIDIDRQTRHTDRQADR